MKTRTKRIMLPDLSLATHFLFVIITILSTSTSLPFTVAGTQSSELQLGFKATPNPSISSFQSLLTDPTGNFSLGFQPINQTQLSLIILHVASSQTIWEARSSTLLHWSDKTQLIFNGSLVILDAKSGSSWSTITQGDKVVLLNSSNLQVQNKENEVVWQSFDFPTNTIVVDQNFTSNMSLVNGDYSMRLGDTFMALYAAFNEQNADQNQIYWKHEALEARADIVDGAGPIYARVEQDGFLGLFQTEKAPVDIQAFNSYHRNVTGFRLVRLESEGNLKGYFWDGKDWVSEYQAITDTCQFPSPCGPYGLCKPGSGCSCLNNQTWSEPGNCVAQSQSGDFCSADASQNENQFWVLRRNGVDLPFKELMGYKTMSSMEQCEGICKSNCSCWGSVYNNASGFCYTIDYPIQTLLGVGDESKSGYFKVWASPVKKSKTGFGVGLWILCGAVLVLIGGVGFGAYKVWKRKRGVNWVTEEECGVSTGPYKNLGSDSFRSIEMCTNTNRQ